MTYRDLFHWLGAGAEQAWLEYLASCHVPERVDLTDPQTDE